MIDLKLAAEILSIDLQRLVSLTEIEGIIFYNNTFGFQLASNQLITMTSEQIKQYCYDLDDSKQA